MWHDDRLTERWQGLSGQQVRNNGSGVRVETTRGYTTCCSEFGVIRQWPSNVRMWDTMRFQQCLRAEMGQIPFVLLSDFAVYHPLSPTSWPGAGPPWLK
jgi:hypothetical protein